MSVNASANEPNLEEARDRRRAKILASKDARLARITGAQKGVESQESLVVDEIVLQEFIAEGRKQAVQLAKDDYSQTHREHESEADELLTGSEIKQKRENQFKEQLAKLHEPSKIDLVLSTVVVIVSAISGAYFLLKRTENDYKFCLNLAVGAWNYKKIDSCRKALLPAFLQTIPSSFGVSLLPLISEFFKKTKSFPEIIIGIFPRAILYLVTLLITLRLLINFE